MIICKLSEILGRKRLRVSDVIKATKISRPTLSNLYHNDSKGINFDTLNTLCEYLNISTDELLIYYPIDIKSIDLSTVDDKHIRITILFKQDIPAYIADVEIYLEDIPNEGTFLSGTCEYHIEPSFPDDIYPVLNDLIIEKLEIYASNNNYRFNKFSMVPK